MMLVLDARSWRRGLIAALLLTTIACSGNTSESTVTEQQLLLELVAQIGCGDCGDARQITPLAMAILDGGDVAVLDFYEPFVRIFGPTGELQRAFGQKGQGPGELGMESPGMYIPGIWLLGNESGGVTVIEALPPILEAFDANGVFLDQTMIDLPPAVPMGQAFDPHTRTYFRLSFSPIATGTSRQISRCRFPDVGVTECDDFISPGQFLEEGSAGGGALYSLALGSTPDGYLVVANTVSYRIWVLNDEAETVVSTGRDVPPPLKTEEEIRVERESLERFGQADREINPNRPHIMRRGVQIDGAGRIWVLVWRDDDGASLFDVFAPDGSYLEEVAVDAILGRGTSDRIPFVINEDTLAAVVTQPDGNDEVWVFRIVAP